MIKEFDALWHAGLWRRFDKAKALKLFLRQCKSADDLDPDVLEASSSGDMVTLLAASGQRCVVSTQRAVRQIWVAGKGLGIHFSFDEASNT